MKQGSKKRSSVRKNSVPRHRLKAKQPGLAGLTQSFRNVGIPTVIETEIVGGGISAHLFNSGNMPVRSGYGIKIKL